MSENKKKYKALKIVALVIAILLLIALTIYLFPIIQNLFDEQGRETFKQEIQNAGAGGILILLGLQGVQILLPILPGEPIEILAGMCYGPVGGFTFLIISVALITTLIFFAVRKLGRSFVYGVVSEEKIKKLENSKIFKNPKKIEYIMLILFLIPGTPKDLLVYIGGLLPIKPLRFILISIFARIPSLISSTMAGASLVKGNIWTGVLVYVLTFLLIGIVVFIAEKRDKTKLTKEIKDKAKYSKPLGIYSLPDWKLCHIESIGLKTNKNIETLDIKTIKEHFRKYAGPDNMFVLPKEIGDLGEIEIFIEEQKR